MTGVFIPERDISGRVINRTASTEKGWAFLSDSTQLTTGVLNSVIRKDFYNAALSDYTFKIYHADGTTECTTQGDADTNGVETRITIKLAFDFDIIEGKALCRTKPANGFCVHVGGGMFDGNDDPVSMKAFIQNEDMSYYTAGTPIYFNGRSSKFMDYEIDGYPHKGNIFQTRIYHAAGENIDFQTTMEYYRA